MEGLEKLKKMAKNGEVSESLLGDEEFKSEFKKTLKEENNIEITDEQIQSIVKNFETILQNEKIINKVELGNVSGGLAKSKIVKGISTILGTITGLKLGVDVGELGASLIGMKDALDFSSKIMDSKEEPNVTQLSNQILKTGVKGAAITIGSAGVGAVGGVYGGYKLGDLICRKLDIK